MASPDKVDAVAELKEKFSKASGVVLTEYRGLPVSALKDLRRALGEDATYRVSKNTLTRVAAHEAGVEGLDELLTGPTAIAFINGDPVNVAKGLRNFAKDNPLLEIKGGVLDGKVLTTDEVKKLADLESREVLLAKLAGAFVATQSKAAAVLAAPLSKFARLQAALIEAAKDNPELIGGAGEQSQTDDSADASTEAEAPEAAAAADTNQAADAAEEK